MKSKIEEVLNKLIEEIEKGKEIEECLKEYPEFASELEPLLLIAKKIKTLPEPIPDPNVIDRTLKKVRDIYNKENLERKTIWSSILYPFRPIPIKAFAIIVLIFVIGWSGISFSARSLPGELLYPIKMVSERIQYSLTINPKAKIVLHISFADRRTSELFQKFNKDGIISRELVKRMLEETERAMAYTEQSNIKESIELLNRICAVNQKQKQTLEKIKLNICSCDSLLINEAINICTQRDCCLKKKLNPDSEQSPNCGDSCSCW